jgi:hypothetical protein
MYLESGFDNDYCNRPQACLFVRGGRGILSVLGIDEMVPPRGTLQLGIFISRRIIVMHIASIGTDLGRSQESSQVAPISDEIKGISKDDASYSQLQQIPGFGPADLDCQGGRPRQWRGVMDAISRLGLGYSTLLVQENRTASAGATTSICIAC